MPIYNNNGYIFGITGDNTAGAYKVNYEEYIPVKSNTKLWEIATTATSTFSVAADTGVVTFGAKTYTPTFPATSVAVTSTNIGSTFKKYRLSMNGNLYIYYYIPNTTSYSVMGIQKTLLTMAESNVNIEIR